MTVDLATLPHPDTLPIPDAVRPNHFWPPLLVEIADHIGARAALLLAERFGGQFVRVPRNPRRGPFAPVLGEAAARELARVFGGERLELPVAQAALRHARRQGVLALVRAGDLSLSDAARLLRLRRGAMTRLVNASDEGVGAAPAPIRRLGGGQFELFD